MKRHCDKRLALSYVFIISKNRHLAEWRFLSAGLLIVIVTLKGPIWKVIRISLTSFRRISTNRLPFLQCLVPQKGDSFILQEMSFFVNLEFVR